MRVQHNVGGIQGLGPVWTERRIFVEPWEERIFGVHVAMMGLGIWRWTDLRKKAESMNPIDYFTNRYYEKWLGGIEAFLVENGYLDGAEIEARTSAILNAADAVPQVPGSDAATGRIVDYLWRGDSPERELGCAPSFQVGDAVRATVYEPWNHTRLPGMLRGKAGVVDLVYEGAYHLPEAGPDGNEAGPGPVYSVRFDPAALWGALAEPGHAAFYADVWEHYLEPA
ncbi:MAG: nitrile hydratase subunit beta [Pseudonocardiaceae bacterium]|nr:nitrile hydratase subunit beta [Pseudonocardiaceae bacterium]